MAEGSPRQQCPPPHPLRVHILLLGSAAGGGSPPSNCWCSCCRIARTNPENAWPRTQSSVAISRDGKRWFLLNASPDIREQLRRIPTDPPSTRRHVPIEGVVLTDAELDHSLGIVLLREGTWLRLFTTSAIRSGLDLDSHILPLTRAFAEVQVTELPLDMPVPLGQSDALSSGLSVVAVVVRGGPPRFAADAAEG